MLQNLYKVIRREIRIMHSRPIYLLGSVGVMLAATLFFTTFMREGMPQKLRIGVVDLDNSSTSRNFRQQLDATQMGTVVELGSVSAAQRELETGRISGYVVVPEHFDEEVQAFHCPKMQVQVNLMYPVIGGALAYKDILYMVNLTNGAVQRQVLRAKGIPESEIMGRLQPVVLDAHYIGNGPTNYSYYLVNMILMGILGMCVTLVVAYSVGSELKYGTSRHLMEFAGGDIWTAIVGKLAPYTLLFTLIGVCLELLLFGPLHYPMAGSVGWLILATLAMVLAYEAVAVFIVSVLPTLRLSVCVSALYSVLGFSFAGFTLPISALPYGVQGLSLLFPLRFYYQIYTREVYFGTGFEGWWPYLLALVAFQLLPFILNKRLSNAYIYQNYPRN
ncbi:MAG: ABC transporter permease [Bacteroidales bacterium]|nr:ABC transporter permease [Bacteroidales bacterium]